MENNIDSIFNETASKVIKKYRESKNMSLEEVVKKMKNPISRQALFKYENGNSRIKTSIFLDICQAMNLDPNEVFNEINQKSINASNKINIEIEFTDKIDWKKIAVEEMINNDFPEKKGLDELEILFSKNKDILTDDDKEMIKFMIEKRKREIDKQLGEEEQ